MKKLFIIFFVIANVVLWGQKPLKITVPQKYSQKTVEIIKKSHQIISNKLQKQLSLPAPSSITIIVCKNYQEIVRLVKIPKWALGVALTHKNIVAINGSRLDAFGNDLDSLIQHEVCHLYIGAWEKKANLQVPQWLNEGICEWISGRLHLDYHHKILDNSIWKRWIPFSQLEKGFPKDAQKASLAYLQSQSMVEFLVSKYKRESLVSLLNNFYEKRKFSQAIIKTYGKEFLELEKEWQESLSPPYAWLWQLAQVFSLFTLMAFLVLVAYWKQRSHAKKLLEQWEEEEND